MKNRKIFLGMAGAVLTASMFTNTVLAAEVFGEKQAYLEINKLLHSNSVVSTCIPDFTFQFTPVSVTGNPAGGNVQNLVANMPTIEDVTISSTVWANADDALAADQLDSYVYDKVEKEVATVSFTEVGTYTYKLTEKQDNSTTSNVGFDTTEYNVVFEVYKTNQDSNGDYQDLAVNVVVYKGDKKVTASFTNTVDVSSDTYIQKMVTGVKGDTSKDYKFTIELSNTSGSYDYVKQELDEEGKWKDIDKSTNDPEKITNGAVFYLKHNQRIVISGLEVSSKYSVTEDKSFTDALKYTTKIDYLDDDKYTDEIADSTVEMTVSESNNGVIFINDRSDVLNVNTGVVADMLPYALIVVASATGIALVLKGRKKEEKE